MAQISVTDREVSEWEPKITGILDWFGQLQSVDVSGVAFEGTASTPGSALRADEVHIYEHRSSLLGQAPEVEKSYVKVPRMATTGDKDAAPSSSAPAAGSSKGSAAPGAPGGADGAVLAFAQTLDVRVGKILSCALHPDAESLYVEQIDVGEAEPRTVVSGLVKYMPLEQMQGRMVLVLCNLKPRNMRGIKSAGMLLAASDAGHTSVEPLAPPLGALPGERAWFGPHSEQPAPLAPNSVEKKKVWDTVQPQLRTDSAGVANLQGLPLMLKAGPVKSVTLANANIS